MRSEEEDWVLGNDVQAGDVSDLDPIAGDDDLPPGCPVCGGPGVPLGHLGHLAWYRCRDCGMDFNLDDQPTDPAAPAARAPAED
jgi:hypothetical protein